jgi:hypothetical protein
LFGISKIYFLPFFFDLDFDLVGNIGGNATNFGGNSGFGFQYLGFARFVISGELGGELGGLLRFPNGDVTHSA